ncbi:hypothetical protein EV177_003462 [Coemansia sp. RSA 1804]|nr:hypothetical protein EV177_003462 [Coemansia sp. RSA 1804]
MASKPLKGRTQAPQVRKSDIRVLPLDQYEDAAQNVFVPAQSTGSGGSDDLCYQRLKTWKHVAGDYLEYFKSMAAAELDLATVYARIGDILKVPLPESTMVLPVGSSDGIQSVTWKLKTFQQSMVESHCAISQTIKKSTLTELVRLSEEAKTMLDSYVACIRPAHSALEHCKLSISKRIELLEIAVTAASDPYQRRKETVKDPFIINIEIEALLRKRAELENRLYASSIEQQLRIKEFESRFVERLSAVVSSFMDCTSTRHKRLRHTAKKNIRSLRTFDAAGEWLHFNTEFDDILCNPQSTHGNASASDYKYAGMDSDWVRVLRQGVVALKEQGPLFRSTWQSKYGVLTTRGYFHVFRSQGDVVRGAPETSVFLPRAQVTMVRSGTLQISSGSRFNRSRITIQDAAASLDNWMLLMESVCYRKSSQLKFSLESGMATPEPSSDESSNRASEECSSTQHAADKLPNARSGGRCSLDTTKAQIQSLEDATATPTRRGRPFSVDASMLAQTPLGYSHSGRPVSFTPTRDIYLQPLSNISGVVAPSNLSQVPDSIDNIVTMDGYSPDYTDSSDRGDMELGNATPSSSRDEESSNVFGLQHAVRLDSTSSSGSSGAPHRPESLFERNGSHGTETGPISSLPKLRDQGSSNGLAAMRQPYIAEEHDLWLAGSRHFFLKPMRATQSDTGSCSIVDLKHMRQFSSSAACSSGGIRVGADIWSSDVLSIPDPAGGRLSRESRQRPRSMIHQPSSSSTRTTIDPTNPYLGEFLAKRQTRSTRVDSRTSSLSTGQHTPLWRSSAHTNVSEATNAHFHAGYRVASQPSGVGTTSPPLQKMLSVGPCPPIAPDSHNSIPEAAYEFDDTCSSPAAFM